MGNEELIRLAKSGDKEAYNQLFRNNEKFIHFVANQFTNSKLDYNELFSTSQIGMLKAYRHFDVDKSTCFLTFARYCMENEIKMMIRKQLNYRKRMLDFSCAVRTSKKSEDIEIEPPSTDEPFENIESKIFMEQVIPQIMSCFSGNQKKVFVELILKGKQQNVVGNEIGLGQSRVSRIRKEVLKRLDIFKELVS